jgi:hypothetical protein
MDPKPAYHCIFFLACSLALSCIAGPVAAAGQDKLLQPSDLIYKGAFRLPSEGDGWGYGGGGLTYYPPGDPGGSPDGYPGSLYGIGNDQKSQVTEISIPVPVISTGKNPAELNTATTLQPFSPVFSTLFTPADDGLPQRADIAYLPPQDSQADGSLYLTWGEHYQYELVPSHAMSRLSLADPQVKGPWYLDGYENFATDDYLFEIPQNWAEQNTPGLRLATGRFRDGSLGGSGPSLFAFGPWNDGNPPARNSRLTHVVPLLAYHKGYEEGWEGKVMAGYTSADEWTGGEWLTAGDKSAVIFAGTKGRGNFWYGFSNGVVWPDNPPYPEYPPAPHNDRGWWAKSFDGVIIFYDPSDLAKVAAGTMAPYEPQPYAELDLDSYLWHITGTVQKMHLGAVAFDRERGILYVAEPFGDGDQPIIHVFEVRGSSAQPGIIQTTTTTGTTPALQTTVPPATSLPGKDQETAGLPEGTHIAPTPELSPLATAVATAAVLLYLNRRGT